MTPRQDSDGHDDNDNPVLPPAPAPAKPPKLRRPLSSAAPEFHPAGAAPDSGVIRPSLELVPPKRSPTVDSLLSALTPDEPRETKEEDTDELWAKLRCGSLRTEEVAEREKQKQERLAKRKNRCADYPGLAFGSAMFGSDTTMKFNIIKNELHNIMRSQLKRVDGEVNALSSRVKTLDMNLQESERLIRSATAALSECVSLQIKESESRNKETESQSNFSAFDQHILYLETQLKEAKVKASQSLQIMEDCDKAQESLLLEPTPRPRPPATVTTAPSSGFATHPATTHNSNTNNNIREEIYNVNNNGTVNSIFENEANNNNNNNNISVERTEVSRDMQSENNNFLQAIITEEDSANGNIQLPV